MRGNNLVTKYIFSEGSSVIPNKEEYMDDNTWEKVVKVVFPGIRKMVVNNVAFFLLYFILYSSNSTPLSLKILCR